MRSAPPDPAARDAALACLERGWSVIPVRSRSKRPLAAWEPFQQLKPERSRVERWFERWPDAGVAIVTGAVSGIVVLDVDPRHGGAASLAELVQRHGPLPATVEAHTGGGGRHLYFAYPREAAGGGLRNRVGLFPGIDVRADGGLVVAPPSVHASGRRYHWVSARAPEDLTPAELPDWLLHRLIGESSSRARPPGYWRELLARGVEQGRRNDTVASLAGHLLAHGIDPEQTLELLLCWNHQRCRPPLPDDEVARTVESIERLHQRGTSA